MGDPGAEARACEEPLGWLDLMSEVEPEFHRNLTTLLRHPMESEQNRWAVGLLTFSRETSGDGGRGASRIHLTPPLLIKPRLIKSSVSIS